MRTKSRSIALIIVASTLCLSLFSVSGLGAVNDENSYYPRFEIISPRATVYHNSTVDILAVVTKLTDESYPMVEGIRYSLNGSDIFSYILANFTYNGVVNLPNNRTGHEYVGRATLEGLKEGNYTLHVSYGNGDSAVGSWWGASVNFRVVYGDYEPAVLFSPINQTYCSSDVPIVFSTNEDYIYAYYCLNGGKPVFVGPNSMLTDLQEGSNNLAVFIKFRDIHSDFKVNFTIDSAQTNRSLNIGIELIILGAVVVIVVLLLLRRHRRTISKNNPNSKEKSINEKLQKSLTNLNSFKWC
jgi:hypothetical protein